MKNILVIILIGLFLGSNVFAQNKPTTQSPQNGVSALQQMNEAKLSQLETLEELYSRLSAEIVLGDALVDTILKGTATRARCTAECDDGTTVTCSGDPCVAIDGVGCGSGDGGPTSVIKVCGAVGIGGVGIIGVQ